MSIKNEIIQFKTQENKMSFFSKFASGELFIVTDKRDREYKLRIESIRREDGGGNRFIFGLTLRGIHSPGGHPLGANLPHKGYIDTKTGSGWIKQGSIKPEGLW